MSDQALWPLRAVSTDPTNVTKLDADGNVLTSTTDVDARYVKKAGDTMTGALAVQVGATFTPPATATNVGTVLHVVRDGSAFIEAYSASNTGPCGLLFRKKYGTVAAPTPVTGAQSMGVIRWQTKPNNGSADRTTAQISLTTTSPETEDGYFESSLGFSCVGYAAGQPNASISLDCTAATGRTISIGADNFFVNNTGGVRIKRTEFGDAVRIDQTGTGTGQTSVALAASTIGSSLTSGGLTGVVGSVSGTCNVGVGVRGEATGTANTNYGLQAFASGGATRNVGLYIGAELVAATGSYAIESQAAADVYFKGRAGLNFAVPTKQLEVGGDTALRGAVEVVGNITSTGLAHSFAANSIPSPAVIGNAAFTPANSAAAGVAGTMRWDANYLYICVASGSWKRVALTAF